LLRRRRKFTIVLSDPIVTIPLVLAALILAWLAVDYWQVSHARQQAIAAFEDSLRALIAVSLDFENTRTPKPDSFSKAVTQFENALLNPALEYYEDSVDRSRNPNIADLRRTIDDCRQIFLQDVNSKGASASPSSLPPSIVVSVLRSRATQVLQDTYHMRAITGWSYILLHGTLATTAVLLGCWALAWPYYLHFVRRY
jgi:hypothetical protein